MTGEDYSIISPRIKAWVKQHVFRKDTACRLQGLESVLGETFVEQGQPITPEEFGKYADLKMMGWLEKAVKVVGENGATAFVDEKNNRMAVVRDTAPGKYDEMQIVYEQGENKHPPDSFYPDRINATGIFRDRTARDPYWREGMTLTGAVDLRNEDGTVRTETHKGFGGPRDAADRAQASRIHETIHRCNPLTS